MRKAFILLSIFFASVYYSQVTNTVITQKMIGATFGADTENPPSKRKLLTFKNKLSRLNPLNYLSSGLLYIYQNVFSEQIQADCAFETSCSEYTKLSIKKSGLFIGTLRGFNQLSECAPNARYEHTPVYLNQNQKIINAFENETK